MWRLIPQTVYGILYVSAVPKTVAFVRIVQIPFDAENHVENYADGEQHYQTYLKPSKVALKWIAMANYGRSTGADADHTNKESSFEVIFCGFCHVEYSADEFCCNSIQLH